MASKNIGHNSGEKESPALSFTGDGREKLKQFVAQLEKLDEERKELAGTIKDVYTVAAAAGFDKKVLRHILKLRQQSKAERDEWDMLVGTYLLALGDIA